MTRAILLIGLIIVSIHPRDEVRHESQYAHECPYGDVAPAVTEQLIKASQCWVNV